MEVPHQYPYNPPVWLILLCFGSGLLWLAVDWFTYWVPGGRIPTGFRFWYSLVGLLPIALALMLGVLRISFENYLLLDDDCMVLPLGLFQMRKARIEYRSISRVSRHYIRLYEYRFVLKVATEERAVSILPAFLPNNESYRALEEFLSRKLLENTHGKKAAQNPSMNATSAKPPHQP